MAHDKVFGFCENKCLVEVASKSKVDAIEETANAANTGAIAAAQAASQAKSAADNAQSTANDASEAALLAMPIIGGTFTGQAVAYSTNRTQSDLRNCVVCNSSWTPVSTNRLVFLRK